MKYVQKEPPKNGFVADAEALMREFNRAMAIAYAAIDQNNISDKGIYSTRIVSPVGQWESSTSIVGQNLSTAGFAPGFVDGTSGLSTYQISRFHAVEESSTHTLAVPGRSDDGWSEKRPRSDYWQFVDADNNGASLALSSVVLKESSQLTVVGSGQINVGDDGADGIYRNSCFDIRLTDNNAPLDGFVTAATYANNGYLPFLVISRRLFLAGPHSFRVQIRDRSTQPMPWENFSTTGTEYMYNPTNAELPPASSVSSTTIAAFGFTR